MKKLGTLVLVAALALGAYSMIAPNTAMGKGKGKPKPPPCNCPEEVDLGNGVICTLSDCGSDCVYVCPFPF